MAHVGVKNWGKQMWWQPQRLLPPALGSHHTLSSPPAARPHRSHRWLCPGGRALCNPEDREGMIWSGSLLQASVWRRRRARLRLGAGAPQALPQGAQAPVPAGCPTALWGRTPDFPMRVRVGSLHKSTDDHLVTTPAATPHSSQT